MPITKKESLATCTKQVESSSKVANNTYKVVYSNGDIAYRLHTTDVVTITKNSVILNSGGWKTNTTKDRIHQYAYQYGIRLSQIKGLWFVTTTAGVFDYFDGIEISISNGKPKKEIHVNLKKVDAIKKQITNYCKLITEDNLPTPSGGDCWDCSFSTKEGVALGDTKNSDHLISHMKEKYVVGSLLINAMREAGYRDEQIAVHYGMKWADAFRRAVRKYLIKRLIK